MLFEMLVWVLHNLDLAHSYNLTVFVARVFTCLCVTKKTFEFIFKVKQKDIRKLTTKYSGLYEC